MKKLLPNVLRRDKKPVAPTRITNETVAEHREQVIAGGKKFKYPIQYARHKLVINALIVVAAALVLLVALGWWQLYPMQNSSGFMYRFTRIFPLPVASVDGEPVLFRDYLVQYRSSEYYLSKHGEVKLDTPDGKRQLQYIKRQSLDKAETVALARRLAREKNITVSDKEVDQFIDQERNTANGRVSQETYDASIQMLYDQSTEDYRLTVKNGILKNKVAFAVDTDAEAQAQKMLELATVTKGDFAKVAADMAGTKGGKVTAGQSGYVNVTGKYSGLRVSEVAKLAKGEMSGLMKSTTDDGYYVVKVVDKNDTQVAFSFVHVPLTAFAQKMSDLKKANKIKEYITISEK